VKCHRLACAFWLPLVLAAVPAAAQTSPAAKGAGGRVEREPSRLQMSIMEDAFQRAVEEAHGHAIEAVQVSAGMPPMFTMEGNTRARAFRIEGYGVFFDVDLPPVPRSFEWGVQVLNAGMLVPEIEQLQQQLTRLNDPRATRVLDPIIRTMQTKVTAGGPAVPAAGKAGDPDGTVVGGRSESQDPFGTYVKELKRALTDIVLQYGTTLQLGADEWLHVGAREVSPKLLPGNPTDATITLRIRASDLAALKAGRLTAEEAARRIEFKEVL
jgi:hypothetical protein